MSMPEGGRFPGRVLRGWLRLETGIGDRGATEDGASVGAVEDSPVGSIQRLEPLVEACEDGLVDPRALERLRHVGVAATCLDRRTDVIDRRAGRSRQELHDPCAFGVDQLACTCRVHLRFPSVVEQMLTCVVRRASAACERDGPGRHIRACLGSRDGSFHSGRMTWQV